ncbi:MAG: isoprenylcysteine carboxylmethyltransferase family protein [Gammaproteobacteria bacterium]|nr:isoprenylcysteine carboxylmethyltransferase family protein [Gammaproteobacteria bacterium]
MRIVFALYGVLCYLMFLGTFLYAVGFVGNFLVPKSMDVGPSTSTGLAIIIDLAVLGVFAVQHSVMARQGFKRWWTTLVPPPIERSTYVLFTNLALILLYWQWRPFGAVLWDLSGSGFSYVLWALCALGWLVVLISTFLIDHFELFGLRQVYFNFLEKAVPPTALRTPMFYKYVRHPIYFGFTVAFWATPVMTTAHLLFAVATTAYMLIGIFLEERDLVAHFQDAYRDYRKQVPMLIPSIKRRID